MRKLSGIILSSLCLLTLLSVGAFSQDASKCGNTDYKCQITANTRQISDNPGNIEAYYNRGRAFSLNGNFDQAIADFDRYIQSKPQDKEYLAEGYSQRAVCYKAKGSLDTAITDYSKAIGLSPNASFFISIAATLIRHRNPLITPSPISALPSP